MRALKRKGGRIGGSRKNCPLSSTSRHGKNRGGGGGAGGLGPMVLGAWGGHGGGGNGEEG